MASNIYFFPRHSQFYAARRRHCDELEDPNEPNHKFCGNKNCTFQLVKQYFRFIFYYIFGGEAFVSCVTV